MKLGIHELGKNKKWPRTWAHQLFKLSQEYGHWVTLDGSHESSRLKTGEAPTELRVTSGSILETQAPWLIESYSKEFLGLAEKCSGTKLRTSSDISSAVTLNDLCRPDIGYEPHVDTNTITGLLLVNTLPNRAGGILEFSTPKGVRRITTKKGRLLFFDGREVVHQVTPLTAWVRRLSVPMNYYDMEVTDNNIEQTVPKGYAMGIE